jgi:Flp pilus assembly protein TadG
MTTSLLFLLALFAFALAWLLEFRKRVKLTAEVANLKLALDQVSIHRDSRGHFIHPGGHTPLTEYEEL